MLASPRLVFNAPLIFSPFGLLILDRLLLDRTLAFYHGAVSSCVHSSASTLLFQDGGGFYVSGGTLTLTTCEIFSNTAPVSTSPAHCSAPLKFAIFGRLCGYSMASTMSAIPIFDSSIC